VAELSLIQKYRIKVPVHTERPYTATGYTVVVEFRQFIHPIIHCNKPPIAFLPLGLLTQETPPPLVEIYLSRHRYEEKDVTRRQLRFLPG
jgi:hypothetical protein